MKRTAQSLRNQLAKANCEYLALRSRQSQEVRVFRFDPELAERITWIRNNITELQSKLRKEVNQIA